MASCLETKSFATSPSRVVAFGQLAVGSESLVREPREVCARAIPEVAGAQLPGRELPQFPKEGVEAGLRRLPPTLEELKQIFLIRCRYSHWHEGDDTHR